MSLKVVHSVEDAASQLSGSVDPVVILPVYNSYDDVVQCYQAFFRHTPTSVALLVVDDGGHDRRVVSILQRIFEEAPRDHHVVVLCQPHNKGFVRTMNDAFLATGRADVIILNSDVIVTDSWVSGLRDAAYSSSTIGTASALTNNGTVISIPNRNTPTERMPTGLDVDEAARRIRAGSPRLRPRIPTAIGHCTYIKRAALDTVGLFADEFSPGYGEEVELSQRMIASGFEHVAADDVFVFHKGGSSFGVSKETEQRKAEHEQIVQNRFPYYSGFVRRVADDPSSPLAASLLAARRSMLGLRLAVDAMCLGPLPAGTQLVVLESIKALAHREEILHIDVFTPVVVPDYAASALAELPNVTIRRTADLAPLGGQKADVVYRPYQVRDVGEIEWLRSVGERLVINQLDLIAYHNPAYFPSENVWRTYRDLACFSSEMADGLTYISEHSRHAATAEGLLREGKPSRVVYCGTQFTAVSAESARRPAGLDSVDDGFILCLGVSYHHKNRPFALKMVKALHNQGVKATLVLVGASPPQGSSLAVEAEYLLLEPDLAEYVVRLGEVSEAEKHWLYAHAGLVLYPTVSEGFGLVPFEAAQHGVPCLSTRQGSLDEVLPKGIPTLDGWSPDQGAAVAAQILADTEIAKEICGQILRRGEGFTWERVAESVTSILVEVTGRPTTRVVAIRGEGGFGAEVQGVGRSALRHSRTRKAFDRAVASVIARPALRQRLAPAGSARQAAARRALDRIGRQL